MPDIDIDFADRDHALTFVKHVPAAIKDVNNTFNSKSCSCAGLTKLKYNNYI